MACHSPDLEVVHSLLCWQESHRYRGVDIGLYRLHYGKRCICNIFQYRFISLACI